MKKMLTLLIALFTIYFGIQFVFNIFSKGYDINYIVPSNVGDIHVHEVLTTNSDEKDNYFIDINYNDKSIPFKIYNTYSRKEKIVRKINIFDDGNFMCVKITLESDETPSDIKCIKNNVSYLYSSIKGQDPTMDQMISSTDYNISKYQSDENDNFIKDKIMGVFPNDFPSKQTLLLEYYKGVYLIGEKVTTQARYIELFNKDVYDKSIQALVGKYYIVANYNDQHEFNEFFVINIDNGSQYTLKTTMQISFNSFVQGTVGNELYLIDKDSKKQYKIDVKNKTVEIVGNESDGALIYSNNEWKTININEVINNTIIFNDTINNTVNGETYDKVYLFGNEENGTYYLFRSNNGLYDVYALYTKSNVKTYLFSTTDINRVFINNDYIYYLVEDKLMVYGSDFGNKKILTNNELRYNTKLMYFVH